jgi:hypothetical protein
MCVSKVAVEFLPALCALSCSQLNIRYNLLEMDLKIKNELLDELQNLDVNQEEEE